MGYQERPSGDPDFIFVDSDVSPQAIDSLRREAEDGRHTEFSSRFFGMIADLLQARKRILIAPMIIPELERRLAFIADISANGDIATELNLRLMGNEAKDLINALYPPVENVEESELRQAYRTTLVEHLDRGNRLVLYPVRRLD